MPSSAQDTFGAQKLEPAIRPDLAVEYGVPMGNSLTVAKGTVLGKVTATGKFKAYADANSDGSEVAKAIAMYDFTTDGSGNVTLAHEKAGTTRKLAPVWIGGYFRTEDLTGLDANGAADLGKIVAGDATTGLLRVS